MRRLLLAAAAFFGMSVGQRQCQGDVDMKWRATCVAKFDLQCKSELADFAKYKMGKKNRSNWARKIRPRMQRILRQMYKGQVYIEADRNVIIKEMAQSLCKKEKGKYLCVAKVADIVKAGETTYQTNYSKTRQEQACKYLRNLPSCSESCRVNRLLFKEPSIEKCKKVPKNWRKECYQRANKAKNAMIKWCIDDYKTKKKTCNDQQTKYLALVLTLKGEVNAKKFTDLKDCFIDKWSSFAKCIKDVNGPSAVVAPKPTDKPTEKPVSPSPKSPKDSSKFDDGNFANSKLVDPKERQAFEILNELRKTPKTATARIQKQLKNFKADSKILERPNKNSNLSTREGPEAWKSAIEKLNGQPPLPSFKWSEGLALSAIDHCKEIGDSGLTGHKSLDGKQPEERFEQYGTIGGGFAESQGYGDNSGEEFMLSFFIDDGQPLRSNRSNILNPKFKKVGIAICNHSKYQRMMVAVYMEDFTPNAQTIKRVTEFVSTPAKG